MAIGSGSDPLGPPRDPFRLMGLKEVAEVLGTNWKNVRDLVEAGELPCVRVGASQEPKVALETLQAWLRAMGDAAGRAAGEQTHRTVRRRSA